MHSKNNEVYFTLHCFLANHLFPVLFNMIAIIGQGSSATPSCLILCVPMNHSTSSLPVHHQLPEFTQTHVH